MRTTIAMLAGAVLVLSGCESDPSQPDSPIVSGSVTPRLSNLLVGATQQLTATALGASGNSVAGATYTWTSAEPNVATVSASGLVTIVGPGSTAIQATSQNASGFATVNATAPVAS